MSLLAGSLAFAGLLPGTGVVPEEFIVRLTPAAYRQARVTPLFHGIQVLGRIDSLGAVLVRADEWSARQIQQRSGVRDVSPNGVVVSCFIPNDPMLAQQWYLPKINAFAAWDLGRGSAQTPIAIVDSGIQYTHPDLAGVYQSGGYDFVNNDSDPMDDFGHGTLVSGVASAATNNSVGVSGLGFGCPVIGIKVANAGGGSTIFNLAQGITYAVDNTNARVINVSLGTSTFNATLNDAVHHALNAGVVVVAAAGNNNSTGLFYPAATKGCVSVGATNQDDSKWGQSNFGSWLRTAAPGQGIHSTNLPSTYGSISGTSMASPLVAGLAGLLYNQLGAGRSLAKANLVRSAVYAGAADVTSWSTFGRIDARDSLRFLKSVSPISFAWAPSSPEGNSVFKSTTDSGGNVFVTHSTGQGNSTNVRIAKYSPVGGLLWQKSIDGFGFKDVPAKIATDSTGNIYLAANAFRADSTMDMLAAKFGPTGALLWKKTWDGTKHKFDFARSLAVGPANLAVVGFTDNGDETKSAVMWALNSANGATVSLKTFHLSSTYGDEAMDVSVRADGKHYVGVSSPTAQLTNCSVLLFHPAANTLQTLGVYNNATPTDDIPVSVKTAVNGDAFVGGFSDASTSFVLRVRSTGGFVWARRSAGTMFDMILDSAGSPIWTGVLDISGTNRFYLTKKINGDTGDVTWQRRIGGFGRTLDEVYACESVGLVQSGGSLIVTGQVNESPARDVMTLWYSAATGQLLRVARYDAGGANDSAAFVTVSPNSKNVYVGCFTPQAASLQARLLRYAP